jgi:hypothetical protein
VLARWGAQPDLRKLPLIEGARGGSAAWGLVSDDDRSFLVGVAPVAEAKKVAAQRPVLVLGEPADARLLQRLVDVTGDGVGLSNGRRLLESAGPADLQQALPALVGYESGGVRALPRRPGSATAVWGTAVPAGPDLWMWIAFAAGAPGGYRRGAHPVGGGVAAGAGRRRAGADRRARGARAPGRAPAAPTPR